MKKILGYLLLSCLVVSVFAEEQVDYLKIYDKQCATCHGDQGNGVGRAGASLSPKPTDFTSEQSKQRLTFDKLVSAISDGVSGTAMAGYSRRFDQYIIHGLAKFIQTQFMGITFGENIGSVTASDQAKTLYGKHCSACHGDNGNTAVWAKNGLIPPPRNFTSADPVDELTRERMITSVTHGRAGTAMMPFGGRLSGEEIESIVDYIRHEFMGVKNSALQHRRPQTPSATHSSLAETLPANHTQVDMSQPFNSGLVGAVTEGENFYQSNCFACHGRKGDGKGPRSHFNTPRPRDFTSPESKLFLNRPRLFQSIAKGKRGTVMPAWGTVLTDEQIANVAEYVFQTFVQPEQKKNFP